MADRYDVVIVGGGITGLAVAWELRKLGVEKLAVLERAYTGSGASGRNVGRIRAMQLEPRLIRLASAAQRKHERLGHELRLNTLFWRAGYAWVLYDDAEVDRMSRLVPLLRTFGVDATLHDARGAAERLPVLRGGEPPAGALIRRKDAIVHHDALIYGLRRRLLRGGVPLLEGHEVVDIQRRGGAVAELTARRADGHVTFGADAVVNATEGWAVQTSALAGIRIPNRRIRHEVLVTEPAKPYMREAVTFYRPVEGWFNQTLRGETVAGVSDPDEPEGLDHSSTFAFLRRTADVLLAKAPRLGHLRVIRQWAGVYDMTPDRFPIVGPVQGVAGFYQAIGYSGRGFALAPVLAEHLARFIVHGEKHEFLEWCDPARFDDRVRWDVQTDYYSGYDHGGVTSKEGAERG